MRIPCAIALAALACGEPLPADVEALVTGGYPGCIKLNAEPIPPTDDDPHEGTKEVHACGVSVADLVDADGNQRLPYPDGTLVIKQSTKADQPYVWLVATARKAGGAWSWSEYTRNFEYEEFVKIPVKERVCTDCHAKVKAIDWIYTAYEGE